MLNGLEDAVDSLKEELLTEGVDPKDTDAIFEAVAAKYPNKGYFGHVYLANEVYREMNR